MKYYICIMLLCYCVPIMTFASEVLIGHIYHIDPMSSEKPRVVSVDGNTLQITYENKATCEDALKMIVRKTQRRHKKENADYAARFERIPASEIKPAKPLKFTIKENKK